MPKEKDILQMEHMFDALSATINKSMVDMAKAFEPFGKAVAKLGNTMSETAEMMGRAMSGVTAKADQYALGRYIPVTDEERDFLEWLIVENIMES